MDAIPKGFTYGGKDEMKETPTVNGEAPPAGRPSPPRVVIADDHPLFREALRRLLGGRQELELVGEAPDGVEALELCRRLRPDLVLMDVSMPRMDGLTATTPCKTVTLDPFPTDSSKLLGANRNHRVVVTGGAKGVKDPADNALAKSYSWTFKTGTG